MKGRENRKRLVTIIIMAALAVSVAVAVTIGFLSAKTSTKSFKMRRYLDGIK